VFVLGSVGALDIAQRWVILDDSRRHQVVQLCGRVSDSSETAEGRPNLPQEDTFPGQAGRDIDDRMARCQNSW